MNDPNIESLNVAFELFSTTKVALLIFGVIVLGLVVKAVTSASNRLGGRFPSQKLILAQFVTIVTFFVYIIGGIYLFYEIIRPPQSLLLAVSGTLAVALGLAIKDLVASVVAGVILIFDRPFQVGDRITFDGIYGEVSMISLRAVRLVTLDDSVVTIPNSKFITDAVASGNFGALDMMIECNFHVDLGADIKLAKHLLYETAVTSSYVFLKKPVTIVLSEVEFAGRPSMQIRVKCYVLDVQFEKSLQSDIMLRGNQALVSAKIKRPSLLESEVLLRTQC